MKRFYDVIKLVWRDELFNLIKNMTNKTQTLQQEQNKSRIFLEITMKDGSVHQKREKLFNERIKKLEGK